MLPQDTLNIITIFFPLCFFCAALFWINHTGLISLSPSLPTAPLWVTQPPEPLLHCRVSLGGRLSLLPACPSAALPPNPSASPETLRLQQPKSSVCLPAGQLLLTIRCISSASGQMREKPQVQPKNARELFYFSVVPSEMVTDTYCRLFWDLQHGECS